MKFCLLIGGGDGEHSGIGLMDISKIFEVHDALFFVMILFLKGHSDSIVPVDGADD